MTLLAQASSNNSDDGGAAAIVVVLVIVGVLVIWPVVVCFMKGKPGMAILGLLVFTPIAWIGALRLAKPTSSWAKKRYGPAQMEEAERRFGDAGNTKPCPECAERVQADAKVCRFCGYRFDKAPA